ncbi:hypothetical protein COLO4_34236 [Corchorus olitorius]|uniref:Uncharacterized protein n=1 Tax=Corchorus olitorius TaxID=93759 RepID=A0A1R3GMS0_9ROSI|nr:hypothetical protein COLO4_34236 [Corchorus olitorius]
MALRSGLLIPKDGVEPPQEQAYSFHHVMAQLEEMMGKLKTMEDKQENLNVKLTHHFLLQKKKLSMLLRMSLKLMPRT